jgi:hypothetical protein
MSCTSSIRYPVEKINDPRLSEIEVLGLNQINVKTSEGLVLHDRNGRWTKSELKGNKAGNLEWLPGRSVEKIIGMSLVSMLGRSGRPEVIDIKGYQNLLNNSERLGALAGLKRRSVDAVLNMDIKVTAIEQHGVYTDKVQFSISEYAKTGKKWKLVKSTSDDKLVDFPYMHTLYSISMVTELIWTKEGAKDLIKSWTESFVLHNFYDGRSGEKDFMVGKNTFLISDYGEGEISFNKAPMPFEEALARVSVHSVNRILPALSTSTSWETRRIDTGGDESSVQSLESSKVEEACQRLENLETPLVSDIYNLGVCYEVVGEKAIAKAKYKEAIELDSDYDLAIEALGAAEGL